MGWQELWQNPELAQQWAERPPTPEVTEMADHLERVGERRVLDIGCGVGRHVVYLAARGFDVTGLDNAPTALALCQENLARADLRATLTHMEMTALDFPEKSFGGAIATQVIHHAPVAVIEAILAQLTHLLLPRGYFVLVVPTPEHDDWGKGEEVEPGTWVDPNHREGPVPHHFCTEEEVLRLLHAYEILSLVKERTPGADLVRTHWRVLAQRR